MSEHQEQPKYWKSLELQSNETGEFMSSPIRQGSENEGQSENSRREFMKIMGASFAMMGASACTRRPVEKIIPYLNKPEEVTPGIANWYASSCSECGTGCGTLVKTREGRPIKLEGNPLHPASQGGLCARGQTSVYNLYDPDRVKAPLEVGRNGGASALSWEDLESKLSAKLREAGSRVRVLTGSIHSPTTSKLLGEFVKGSGGTHVVYDATGPEEVGIAGELSYGTRVLPHYRFDKAAYVLSFGADFVGNAEHGVENQKNFAKARRAAEGRKEMLRYVAFESVMTISGSNADDRYPVRSGDELKAALAIASELIVAQGRSRFASDGAVTGALRKYSAASVGQEIGVPADVIKKVAKELWEHRGRGIVLGGGHTVKGDNGVALEVVANLLNSALENEGAMVDGTVSPTPVRSSYVALTKLIADMKAGQVDALLIYGVNPVYSLPKALGFADALGKVKTVIAFGMHLDETAKASDYLVASNHDLESWGDVNSHVGVYSIKQPTVAPLNNTRAFEEVLLAWGKKLGYGMSAPNWHEYLKANWKQMVHAEYNIVAPFGLFWESVLRDGVFDGIAAKGQRGSSRARNFSSGSIAAIEKAAPAPSGMVATLYEKSGLADGRFANNAWLQELPDPVTKITWDNYASVSPATAKKLGVSEGDVLRVKVGEAVIELPTHVQPGQGPDTVAMAVGYGRQGAGRVGDGVGANVFAAAVPGKQAMQLSALGATVEKTGKTRALASTQKHHSLESRPIIKETTFSEYKKDPHAGNHKEFPGGVPTLWPKHEYSGYRWAMAIDLNTCTGCSACVVACQVENNVPVVGREFVLTGREMHWLRIDRYYSGKAENPETVHQPMLCQHCENAPCETVCPVLATLHDDEGLNQQVYNRCVGTRYCSNNCPYKVRRFNWFTFTDVATPLQLAYNPDLTVRTRGVMEKCTFCVQRIRGGKDHAKDMGRGVRDGEVQTACQQSCPSDAIVFGDINDKTSRISKLATDPRGFYVLEELNTQPSITYLTKIRNNDNATGATHEHT